MRRCLPLLLAVPLAAAALAGCGSSDDLNPDVVAQAADKTASAGSAKMALTARVQGQTVKGDGYVDTAGEKSRVRLTVPGAGDFESVFVKRTIYLRFPEALSGQIPGGKRWVKVDLKRFGQAKGIDFGSLAGPAGSDPSSQLDQLRGAGDVKKVGTEKVRGVETTRYTAKVDLRKAADKAPASRRAEARRSIDNLIKLSGQRTIPVEVWLDDAGRLRRQKVTQKIKGETTTVTTELYDFGAREEVKAPPASQTTDVTDLAARNAGG
ncbi:MAG TPA: hypothetical protein VGJ70_04695 [Solirubrobacteraceae bacterium]